MIFLGDIHGSLTAYRKILNAAKDHTFQVGDFGFGWFDQADDNYLADLDPVHRFIRGNHDHPTKILEHSNYLGHYGFLAEQSLFHLGGAWSFDWYLRTKDLDWWLEEELNDREFAEALEIYKASKPRIVVTHDSPREAFVKFLEPHSKLERSQVIASENRYIGRFARRPLTSDWLQKFYEEWQPEIWIHGHHHRMTENTLNSTKFVCLPMISNGCSRYFVYQIDGLRWDQPLTGSIQGNFITL